MKNKLYAKYWPEERREQRWLTASPEGLVVDVFTGGYEQQLQWYDCCGSLFLETMYGQVRVGRKGWLELVPSTKDQWAQDPQNTAFHFSSSTGLLQESATGKAVRVWMKNTKVKAVENYNPKWWVAQWDMVLPE